jgi:hypothetical protein
VVYKVLVSHTSHLLKALNKHWPMYLPLCYIFKISVCYCVGVCLSDTYESGVELLLVRNSTSASRDAYISSRECMSWLRVECCGEGAGLSRASPSNTVCTGK